MKRVKIQSRRLLVRNLKISDHKLWKQSCLGRKTQVNSFDPGPLSEAEVSEIAYRKKIQRWKDRNPVDGFLGLGIFNKKQSLLYGVMDIHFLNMELRWANLGFEVSNQYWGRGIATEAAGLGLQVAFNRLNAHRVELGCDPDNIASHGVIKKLGLNYEGMRRNFFPWEDGDLLVYALSAPEFSDC